MSRDCQRGQLLEPSGPDQSSGPLERHANVGGLGERFGTPQLQPSIRGRHRLVVLAHVGQFDKRVPVQTLEAVSHLSQGQARSLGELGVRDEAGGVPVQRVVARLARRSGDSALSFDTRSTLANARVGPDRGLPRLQHRREVPGRFRPGQMALQPWNLKATA